MQIDGKNVAGAGTTALGIIGTVLGGLAVTGFNTGNGCGNGLFGNNGCNNRNNCGCNGGLAVDAAVEMELNCKTELAQLKAERYSDMSDISLYEKVIAMSNKADDKINANYVQLASFIAALDKETALNKQANQFETVILNNKIDCCCDKLRCYVDGTFVPGHLRLSPWDICTGTMAQSTTPVTPSNV